LLITAVCLVVTNPESIP